MNLQQVLRRWRRRQILALGMRAMGVAAVGLSLSWAMLPDGALSWWVGVVLGLGFGLGSLWLPHPPKVDRSLLARHLDRVLPELEDSADLVNRDPLGLTSLEVLQLRRVEDRLEEIGAEDIWPRSQVTGSLKLLLGGLVIALLVWLGQVRWTDRTRPTTASLPETAAGIPQARDLLSQVRVEISPPSYTGLPGAQQSDLDIVAPEGSRVRWWVPETAGRAALLFPDREPLELAKGAAGLEREMTVRASAVYQLVVSVADHEERSPYARVVVTPDAPPRLDFIHPAERVTTITATPADDLSLLIEAQDDYGLEAVDLVTTLAQGSGELVEFRQHRRPLALESPATSMTLESELELASLGLEPGAELYFYVEGRDRRDSAANVARSATYIVRIPAARAPSADLGEGLPIVVPPDYFRSQRQIIIDTEKLISEASEISGSELARRSEGLGFDQRALRMRYGILLGEEFESGRAVEAGDGGDEDDGEHDHPAGEEDGLLAAVPADLVHFHDSAEIATFFVSEIRTQLKQVLAHMWDAEGELRVHRPEEALPFEYQALELLKDLQQRSRIYVQKVGFETPPLEPQRVRLTGDLDGIDNRSRVVDSPEADALGRAAEKLVAALQGQLRPVESDLTEALTAVRRGLADLASRDTRSLAALTALDLWVGDVVLAADDQAALEAALWELVATPRAAPRQRRPILDPLEDLYRGGLASEDES